MPKTKDDLQAAFAGESQANRRYLVFAKVAEAEGKKNLAKLFRAVAEGETVHALNHFSALGEVKNSSENLKTAITGETYEVEIMYPGFIADAQAESEKRAELSFTRANKVEKIHQKAYTEALAQVEAGKDIEEKTYYVCSVCGYLAEGDAPDNCPVCQAPKEKFFSVN
jgi:rubrerythrin